MELDQTQKDAVKFAVENKFSIINGGAGCGKTTIIKEIAKEFGRSNVELCAFAGKAAARLKEATGIGAATIHRMLEYKGEFGFTRRSLKDVNVIVDEASMVSSDLMAEIVKRRPKTLTLVGDEAQLPPVGAGQPFHDIIHHMPEKVATLTKCYRNTEAIFKAATAIRGGSMPLMQESTESEQWCVSATGGSDSTHASILTAVKSGVIDFSQDVILCCRNGEESVLSSVETMNTDIKAIVNPSEDPITTGDRIINTKNMPDLDIWNGTTGRVARIDHGNGVWFELDYPILDWARSTPENPVYIKEVLVPKEKRKHLQLAYALTVHKAQGSQYRKVFFVCLTRDQTALLDRAMVYTAITRARKECWVVGEPRALQDAIRTIRTKDTVFQQLVEQEKAK